jgi:peptidoglycan/LPS O-acetylase OafA/YrhL
VPTVTDLGAPPDRTGQRTLSRARTDVIEEGQRSGAHLPVLDGLRGVAILLVFVSHTIAGPLQHPTTRLDAAMRAATGAGWIGVDLFFVLSGFLVTGILLDTKGQPNWWTNFVARRALRIFPLYYGALIALFIILPRVTHWSDVDFATLQGNQTWYWTYTVNLLSSLTDGRGTPLYTGHLWSLSIEEQFYVTWPLVVWACPAPTLLRVCALAPIGGLVFRLGLVLHDPHNALAAYALTPGRLDALTTGAALAVVARRPGGLARLGAWAPLAFGVGVVGVGALAMWRGGLSVPDPVVAVAAYPLVALIFGALLVMAVTAPPPSALARALCQVLLRRWGLYSYGIYIVHYPLLGAIARETTFYQRGAAWLGGSRLPPVLVLAAVVMVLSYTLASVSYHAYERRFLALKHHFGRQADASPRRGIMHSPTSPYVTSAGALAP